MTDLDTLWAAVRRGAVVSLEVAELEERLHDEPICEAETDSHAPGYPCGIVATHRLKSSCWAAASSLLICSRLAAALDLHLSGDCSACGRSRRVCWVVTEL